jgi:hypothetical protein
MADRIKQTAKDELVAAQQLATDSLKSGAYLYPLKVPK